ncbi:MAG TPA: polysaccharide deacetylase family protein [Solirubrobacteraceae bacterium]|jgi:peptidoglycan/xylan/chitin deacetylase (PgdA/CDA1 family)|nr:polysaccharide deacetylase family protein [Solirubrobacteraceae bacterium]
MNGASTIRRRVQVRSLTALARAALGPDVAAHHRRRRLVALLGFPAVVALIVGIAVGAGDGGAGPRGRVVARRGFFAAISALAGTGAGSLAADVQADQNAAISKTLAYTPYVRIAGSQHRELALTFDDGPGPYTPVLLRVLERMHVPATFFEVGVLEQYFHASTTQIVADGDVIGDHTQLHEPMSHLSARDQTAQLLKETSAIGAYGAPFPRLFRPPYGLWNKATLSLLKRYRMLMVLWTVDTNDYRQPGVQAIVDSAVGGARPGAIILMHDAGGNRSETVAGLPTIIRHLRRKGYRLVTVPQLLLDNPAPANQSFTPAMLGSGS